MTNGARMPRTATTIPNASMVLPTFCSAASLSCLPYFVKYPPPTASGTPSKIKNSATVTAPIMFQSNR